MEIYSISFKLKRHQVVSLVEPTVSLNYLNKCALTCHLEHNLQKCQRGVKQRGFHSHQISWITTLGKSSTLSVFDVISLTLIVI